VNLFSAYILHGNYLRGAAYHLESDAWHFAGVSSIPIRRHEENMGAKMFLRQARLTQAAKVNSLSLDGTIG
jgi:hypothetical protein